MSDVAIIGGGAAGMVAAISAARQGSRVTIYEGQPRVGKKILTTGNGRCNLTNINADTCDYHGENPSFINGVKEQFWVKETIEFFNSIGVLTRVEEDGKVYPYSNQASSVLDALRFELELCGVNVVLDFEVCDIIKKNKGFMLKAYDGRREKVDSLIIAAGSKAAPSTGSKGGGYALLEKFGHTVTELKPSLVQIKTNAIKSLKGIKINAEVCIGNEHSAGELLFTEYGLSGPPIFYLSAYLDDNKHVLVDIMPEYTSDEIFSMIKRRISHNPNQTTENICVGMINKRVFAAILKQLGIEPITKATSELTDAQIKNIARTIKCWQFDVQGTMSWNNAQVTKGGIRTAEFNSRTLESNIISGIFAVGEILDIDGNCGGYNLQWAWASGYIAGYYAAQ